MSRIAARSRQSCRHDRRMEWRAVPNAQALSARRSYSRPPHCVGVRERMSRAASASMSAISQAPTMCSGAVHRGARASARDPRERAEPDDERDREERPAPSSLAPASRATISAPSGPAASIHSGRIVPSHRACELHSDSRFALAVRGLRVDPLPAAPELRPVRVHPAVEEAVGKEDAEPCAVPRRCAAPARRPRTARP